MKIPWKDYLKKEAEALKRAEEKYRSAVKKIQKECSHEIVCEMVYCSGISSYQEGKVCANCGLHEMWNGKGFYEIFTEYKLPRITKEQFYKLRLL